MYEVLFSDKARKQFEKLERPLQERIVKVLERVRFRPEAYITQLVGDTSFKLRVGDYRLIMEINHRCMQILVIKLGHRKNIYD